MATKIEWTDETWNPIRARNRATGGVGHFCIHVSDGCKNCYAERMQPRFNNRIRYAAQDREKVELFLDERTLTKPLGWRKPRMVFVCSMTDLFADFVPDEWIDRVFAVARRAPLHTFQILTKRAERMQEYINAPDRLQRIQYKENLIVISGMLKRRGNILGSPDYINQWPLANVWLGVSAEDQTRADECIPHILDTPAAVRFLSAEPLIRPVDLSRICLVPQKLGSVRAGIHLDAFTAKHVESGVPYSERGLDWIIAGGESGPKARDMDPDWARSIRDQCKAAGVAFFMKQMARKAPIPADLQIRELPQHLESAA